MCDLLYFFRFAFFFFAVCLLEVVNSLFSCTVGFTAAYSREVSHFAAVIAFYHFCRALNAMVTSFVAHRIHSCWFSMLFRHFFGSFVCFAVVFFLLVLLLFPFLSPVLVVMLIICVFSQNCLGLPGPL